MVLRHEEIRVLSFRRGVDLSPCTNRVSRRLSVVTPARIGKEVHLSHCGSVSSAVSRMKKVLAHDIRFRKRVGRLEQELKKNQSRT